MQHSFDTQSNGDFHSMRIMPKMAQITLNCHFPGIIHSYSVQIKHNSDIEAVMY